MTRRLTNSPWVNTGFSSPFELSEHLPGKTTQGEQEQVQPINPLTSNQEGRYVVYDSANMDKTLEHVTLPQEQAEKLIHAQFTERFPGWKEICVHEVDEFPPLGEIPRKPKRTFKLTR